MNFVLFASYNISACKAKEKYRSKISIDFNEDESDLWNMVQELLQNIEISKKKKKETVFYNKHNSLFEHFLEKVFF